MKYLRIINLAIAVITIISGLMQLIAPSFVLNSVGVEITPTTKQLFATIGMFMIMFGGLIVQALYSVQQNGAAILWGALQKIGASLAVFIGIFHHLFSPVAALVASFDFVSFILLIIYYRNISKLN
ncbi:MAG TPA: hypothetical protein VGI43_17805 [Mucilaginibacter sp.]